MLAYSLTGLTGAKKSSQRRAVVMSFEVSRRPFIITLISAPIGIIIGVVLLLVLQSITRAVGLRIDFTIIVFVVPVIVVLIALWLFDSRQRNGMKLTRYKAMQNSARAKGKGGANRDLRGVVLVNGRIPEKPKLLMHEPLLVEQAPPSEAPEDIRPTRRKRLGKKRSKPVNYKELL